ncbi:MAG: hypothetical protein DI563_22475 [Variovorax paradoxus]|uniref:Uncharacterized protein n=1 Tax=Variovorax paradoxus TaxID=34073 RepID=A0A2W5PPE1_VARPD|nr:MAG: hypothetical protein DI563_22475 [Variovorax paradoxus]
MVRYGFEYIGAAILVEKHESERRPHNVIAPMPAYFLAAHGIELTFKAYLRFRGVSARDLTLKIGHDLHRCNEEAKRLGLDEHFKEHGQDTAALELLMTLNGPSHSLRYFQSGMKTFPLWSLVEPLAVRLHQAVAPLVGYHTFEGITYSAYQ